MVRQWLMVACFVVLSARASAGEQSVRGIPLKPDPPFAIDGDLSDWSDVPCAHAITRADQVVWGRGAWTGPADLSG
ncbi:MAG: hypothetical protein GXP27_21950, partial [Planctomycetes bacterium]|nr:hypothetical protein [Planctomycetota bacterium]